MNRVPSVRLDPTTAARETPRRRSRSLADRPPASPPGRFLRATAGYVSLLVAASLAGCGGSRPAAAVARDSAGVRVVENTGPRWRPGEEWRVEAEPMLDIGVMEGVPEYQLFQVVGARRLADDGVVVANAGTHELRFYDRNGRFVRAVGGEGDGPGEFRQLGRLFLVPPDSLVAYDYSHDRLSVFDGGGDFVRSFRLEAPSGSLPLPIGVLEGRRLVSRSGVFYRSGEVGAGRSRDPVVFSLWNLEGEGGDSVAAGPGDERFVRLVEGGMMVTGLLFGQTTESTVAPGGLYIASTDRYEIRVMGADGATRMLIRRAVAPRPVTAADMARAREDRAERVDEAFRPQLEAALRDMPVPETMPAHGRMLVDDLGHLWVQDYRPPGGEDAPWAVFDPQGAFLGELRLPEGLRPWEIGADWILGSWRDPLEVEHVRIHRLSRSGAPAD